MSYFSQENMPSAKAIISTAASIAATSMIIRTIANDLLPDELHDYFITKLKHLFTRLSSRVTIVIEEFEGLSPNQVYEAADAYLGTKITPSSTPRFKVSKPEQEKTITISIDKNQEIVDVFRGMQLNWKLSSTKLDTANSDQFGGHNHWNKLSVSVRKEVRTFELSFDKKCKERVLGQYIPYVLNEFKKIREEVKVLKLNMIEFGSGDYWKSTMLNHPSTFDTMAMDSELKKALIEDLTTFVQRKEFYKRVGKAWKRGYLLYGPPGTGKSSLVAAMANFLKFDIYDLELSEVGSNGILRKLLLGTGNRSIIVFEDIDRTIELEDRRRKADDDDPYEPRVTLSGLLNFIDGLWSTCGEERIIVFTTNYKDRLDPALLRPGRMDMHIHMSYCTTSGFHLLASNYLGRITDHPLFQEIEGLIETIQVTPAEVAGELMKGNDVEISLHSLLDLLRKKKIEHE